MLCTLSPHSSNFPLLWCQHSPVPTKSNFWTLVLLYSSSIIVVVFHQFPPNLISNYCTHHQFPTVLLSSFTSSISSNFCSQMMPSSKNQINLFPTLAALSILSNMMGLSVPKESDVCKAVKGKTWNLMNMKKNQNGISSFSLEEWKCT